jgi:RHS repeat-associated protein
MITGIDAAGNAQALQWDKENHLQSHTQGSSTSTYIYDADGNRLIARTPSTTTLYLAGDTQIDLPTAGGAPLATRYYGTSALRDATGLRWTAGNQGTSTVQIKSDTLVADRRRMMPYGEPRTPTPPTWLGKKGFVGGVEDVTGLTHLGAREYDPTLGRFISVDPIMDFTSPQQWHPYSYSNNNPTTFSDPSGLVLDDFGYGYWTAGSHGEFETKHTNLSQYSLCPSSNISAKACAAAYAYGKLPSWEARKHLPLFNPEAVAGALVVVEVIVGFTPVGVVLDVVDAARCAADISWQCVATSAIGFVPVVGDIAKQCAKHCDEVIDGIGDATKKTDDVPTPTRKTDDVPTREEAPSCNSFGPDTLILLADGQQKKIKDIQIGDTVVATDPETGQTEAHSVTQLHVNNDHLLTYLTVIVNGESKLIETTWEHPFWSETRKEWVKAAELSVGEKLRALSTVEATVANVGNYVGTQIMYNPTIAELHTYYVMAGNTPLLVHNDDGDELVTVGRWMREIEYNKMIATGMVQEGAGGFTYVVYPASRDTFTPTYSQSIYVEFDVPKSSLVGGGRGDDYKMMVSDHRQAAYWAKKGKVPGLPEAKNISRC